MKPNKSKSSPRSSGSPTVPAPQSALRTPHSEIVLFAVTGMSPAVLTETVWALAHASPPVIPHRVIAVTTLPGKARGSSYEDWGIGISAAADFLKTFMR